MQLHFHPGPRNQSGGSARPAGVRHFLRRFFPGFHRRARVVAAGHRGVAKGQRPRRRDRSRRKARDAHGVDEGPRHHVARGLRRQGLAKPARPRPRASMPCRPSGCSMRAAGCARSMLSTNAAAKARAVVAGALGRRTQKAFAFRDAFRTFRRNSRHEGAPNMSWYYAENNERRGPIEDADFQSLVAAGTIKPDTLVWREGLANGCPTARLRSRSGASASASSPATVVGSTDTSAQACSQCGRLFPADEMVSYEGRYICAECKPLFFQKIKEGALVAGQRGYAGFAGFWIRFGAKIVDGIICKRRRCAFSGWSSAWPCSANSSGVVGRHGRWHSPQCCLRHLISPANTAATPGQDGLQDRGHSPRRFAHDFRPGHGPLLRGTAQRPDSRHRLHHGRRSTTKNAPCTIAWPIRGWCASRDE